MPPRAQTVEVPEEVAKLREWLIATYGSDLPEPERWRSHVRLHDGELPKVVASRDLVFLSNDEPPRRITSRLEVARLVGYAPPAPAKRPRRDGEAEEEEEEEEEAPVSRKANALQLLQAAMARRTPHGGSGRGARGAEPPAAPVRASEPVAARPKPPAAAPKRPRVAEEELMPSPPPPPPLSAPPPPRAATAEPLAAPAALGRLGSAPPARTFKRPVMAARRVAHVCTCACPLQCAGWVGLAALVGSRT